MRLREWAGGVAPAVFALCLGIATTLYVQGYTFGRSNQTLYLLDALRQSSPQLFHNDWLLTHTVQYHFTFGLLTRCFMRLGILQSGFLVGYLGLVLMLHLAWYGLVRRLGGTIVTYLGSVLFLYAFTAGMAPGDCDFLQDHSFLPSNIANIALLWGITMWVGGRFRLAAACLGLAGTFHLNHALGVMALWAGLGAWQWYSPDAASPEGPTRPSRNGDEDELSPPVSRAPFKLRDFIVGGVIISLLSLPSVLPVLLHVRSGHGSLPLDEYVDLFVRLRAPHHFEPTSWPVSTWLGFLWPMPLAAYAYWRGRRTPARREAARVFVLFSAAISVSLIGAGVWYFSQFLIHLSFYRFSIFPKLLACIGAAYLLDEATVRWRHHKRAIGAAAAGAAVVLAFVALHSLGLVQTNAFERMGRYARTLVFLSAATIACACLGAATFRRIRGPLYAVATIALVTHASISCYHWLGVDEPSPQENDYLALCDWARDPAHTSVNDVFLVPPEEQIFRLRAERAIVVNFKGVPPLPSEMPEWRDRLEAVLDLQNLRTLPHGLDGAAAAMASRYASLPPQRLTDVARRYNARYLLLPRRDHAGLPRPVYENNSYQLYDLGA